MVSKKGSLKILFLAFLMFAPGIILSDQAAWNTPAQADKILKFIKIGDTIRHYCAPCDDEFWYSELIESIEKEFPEKGYVEILINDVGADFAYVYVLHKGKWRNAAMLAGIPVEGVPEILPDSIKEDTPEEDL